MISVIVSICIQKGYVTQEEAPWLHYALEKRIASLLVFIPLLVIGLHLTNFNTILAFHITFYSLRSSTNGIHATTLGGCLIGSIVLEILFLGILPALWNTMIFDIVLGISIILIWIYAPYNHPNMNLSVNEIHACVRSVRKRLIVLILVMIAFRIGQQFHFANGIILGISMTSLTLFLAYLPIWRK